MPLVAPDRQKGQSGGNFSYHGEVVPHSKTGAQGCQATQSEDFLKIFGG
jgi:hypothetical protein